MQSRIAGDTGGLTEQAAYNRHLSHAYSVMLSFCRHKCDTRYKRCLSSRETPVPPCRQDQTRGLIHNQTIPCPCRLRSSHLSGPPPPVRSCAEHPGWQTHTGPLFGPSSPSAWCLPTTAHEHRNTKMVAKNTNSRVGGIISGSNNQNEVENTTDRGLKKFMSGLCYVKRIVGFLIPCPGCLMVV